MATQYDLAVPSWTEFAPLTAPDYTKPVTHYSASYRLTPPPLSVPAILSFLTLNNSTHIVIGGGAANAQVFPASSLPELRHSFEWECEWERCRSLGRTNLNAVLTHSFKPGSIEGMWEGIFTVKTNIPI
jgi:hypothetical protein